MNYQEGDYQDREYMESEEFEVKYLPRGTMLDIEVQEDALPSEIDRSRFLVHGRESSTGERVFDRLHLYFFYFTEKFVDENGTHEGGQSVIVDEVLQTKDYIDNTHPAFTTGLPVRVYGGMSLGNNPVPVGSEEGQAVLLKQNIPERLTVIPLE